MYTFVLIMILEYITLISCVKLLLIPAYFSTDFEVHRNWLAITHSLPIEQWYFESTSEGTLDYPPLFAWFEYLLSNFAQLFDKEMLKVTNPNYISASTVLFQRLSVIVSDLIFAYGCCRCGRSLGKNFGYKNELFLILFGNAGLLMVDHIHFQYNGILFGILLLSIANMMEDKFCRSAFWFSVLLCMKHIFMYVAPAYFVYLLRHYCFKENNKNGRFWWHNFSIKNFLHLGLIVVSVVFFTFIPFYDQIPQVLSRLFPFKRGLCHAYWAPNFWALYNVVDKAIVVLGNKFGLSIKSDRAVMTGGLVQEYSHAALLPITPLITLICTVVFMTPILIKLWMSSKSDKSLNFIRSIVLCAAVSFLFGWHVHEKAILILIIPMSILAMVNKEDASTFLQLSIVGHYSLFPLLYPQNLLYIKLLLLILHSMYVFHCISKIYSRPDNIYSAKLFLNRLELIYLLGFTPLFLYDNYVHTWLKLSNSLPFFPLLLTSVYCSVGVLYLTTKYYIRFLINS